MRERAKAAAGKHVWFGFTQKRRLTSVLQAQVAAARAQGKRVLLILTAENMGRSLNGFGKKPVIEDALRLEKMSRYLQEGAVDKDALISRLSRFAEDTGGDALAVVETRPDLFRRAELFDFETEIGALAARTGTEVICAHKLSRPLAAVEISLARGHSHLLIDGLVCSNPQEMPFGEALEPQPQRMLASMKSTARRFERRKLRHVDLLERFRSAREVVARRNRDLELLNALDLRLGQSFDMEHETEIFLEMAERAADLRESAVWLSSAGDGWLDLIGYRSLPEPVLDTRMPFGIDPASWFSRYLNGSESSPLRKTVIAVPLAQEDRLVGLFCAVRGDGQPLDEEQTRLLSTMAGTMARVLIRIAGFQQLELSRSQANQERRAAELISDVAGRVTGARGPDEFFAQAQDSMCRFLDTSDVSCVVSVRYNDVVVDAGCALISKSEREWLRKLPVEVLRRLATDGVMEIAKDDALAPTRGSSYYLARVLAAGDLVGVWMFRAGSDEALRAPHLRALLRGMAEQSGHYLALDNEKTKAAAEGRKGEALVELVAGLDSTTSPESLLRRASVALHQVFDCSSAIGAVLSATGQAEVLVVVGEGERDEDLLTSGMAGDTGGVVLKRLPDSRGPLYLVGDDVLKVLTVSARDRLGAQGLLFAPLVSGLETYGYLLGLRKDTRPVTAADMSMIEGIAHVAGVTIAGMAAYRQALEKMLVLSKKVEEIKHLHEIDRLMLSTRSIAGVLGNVVNSLPSLLPLDAVAIGLLDENAEVIELEHTWSRNTRFTWPRQASVANRGSLAQAVGGRIAYGGDRRVDFAPDSLDGQISDAGFLSQLWVPLTIRDKVVGVLILLATRPTAIEQSHLEIVDNLASQVSVALRNTELLEASVSSERQLKAVNAAHNAFSGDSSLEKSLAAVGAQVRAVLGCDYVAIGVYDLQGKFRFVPTGMNGEQVLKIGKFPSGKGLLGHLLRHKGVTRLADLSEHPGSVGFPPNHPPMRSFLGGSIVYGGQSLGALYCTDEQADAFTKEDESLVELMTASTGIGLRNVLLLEQMHEAFLAMVKSLSITVEMRDPGFTFQHLERVPRYSVLLAKRMGLNANETEGVRAAAYLHDLGKIGVPEAVLRKRGLLSGSDWRHIHGHPIKGYDILSHVSFPWPIQDLVRHHHEHFDGSGYPDKLGGEAIPLGARIIGIVDAWDAMTNDRPYRKRLTESQARRELAKGRGRQFDPALVDQFIELLNEEDADEAEAA